MGSRGIKPKGKVCLRWSSDLAYVVGLLVTDGSLSKDTYHLNFVSTDLQLVGLFKNLLKLENKIGEKKNKDKVSKRKTCYVLQFGDVLFYRFLNKIGLTSNKTKTIGEVSVPKKYYRDFLRGSFDGDGSSYSYFDKRWKNSFMFYVAFVSASREHIYWLQYQNKEMFGVVGFITKIKDKEFYQLRYAKKEGMVLAKKMYYNPRVPCLTRKREKLLMSIDINAQVL